MSINAKKDVAGICQFTEGNMFHCTIHQLNDPKLTLEAVKNAEPAPK